MTTKRREKRLFDIDDLINVFVSLWTEDNSVFIQEATKRLDNILTSGLLLFSGAHWNFPSQW
jgi:hypothetical protein